ncbi:MAG: hypothetical protein ACO3RV_05250, partial [Luteolibacter sp.]
MKRFHPLMPALFVGLVVLIVLWRSERPQNLNSDAQGFQDRRHAESSVDRDKTNALPGADRFAGALAWRMARKGNRLISTELQLPVSPEISWGKTISESAFEEFRVWAMSLPQRIDKRQLAEGSRLARSRRAAMLQLIQSNPRRALQLAVPSSVKENLPDEIAELLEESVDGFGDLVAIATSRDRGCRIDREVTLRDGRKFDAYTYGRRSAIATRDNIAIHGVAIDDQLALGELPGRLVESADSSDTIGIVFGDERIVGYDNEAQALAALLLAEENELSGASAALANDLDGVIAYSPATEGEKTLLIIRVDFPDFQGGSASDSQLQALISDMNSVYRDMSYGKASFALNGQGSAFTPTLRLPNNASYYNNFGRILTAARSAAATAGYNYNDYTYEVVVTGNQPVVNGSAGVAFVGSRGAWLHNRQWNLKTSAHEIGHN